jgi:4-amino-4-deoxy-L-arabinose transferase-like glycosyltransferase
MPRAGGLDLIDRLARGRAAYLAVALIALAAALPGVFRAPPLDRDESRYAQATVQMLDTRDFVRIAFQDEPRNKKPIGIYWLQAASVSLLSSPDARAIWAYRLPSVLGAMVAAAACFWGGAGLIGRRAAFVGAALLAATVLLSTEAMIAKTDAALCGATALGLAALARLYAGGPARPLALVFWAAMAVGVLIKGPVEPLVAGLSLLCLGLWERRAAWMRPLLWPSGPLLAAAIAAPWFVAIGLATHGDFFAQAVGGDMGRKLAGGDEGHSGWPGYHLLLLPLLAFPVAAALPGGLALAWRALRAPADTPENSGLRFLIAWTAPAWFFFELLPTKLPHYTLPTYPALALLAGAGLAALFERPKLGVRVAGAALFLIAAAALTAGCAFLSTLAPGDAAAAARRATQTAMVIGLLMIACTLAFAFARTLTQALTAALAAALIFAFTAKEQLLPEARQWQVSQEVSDMLARGGLHPRLSPAAGPLTAVGYAEPSLVFLTRTDTRLAEAAEAAARAAAGQAMLVEGRQEPRLADALAARGLAFAPVGEPVEGFDYSDGERVALQAGRIVSARAAGTARSAPP